MAAALELAAVAVRDVGRAPRARACPAAILSDAPAHLVADDDIDVIVELMGGDEPAHTLIAAALSMGKPVVTANKHVIAHHGPELEAIARRTGRGAPVRGRGRRRDPGPRAARRRPRRRTGSSRVRGIVNGTTNFILTRDDRRGRRRSTTRPRSPRRSGSATPRPTRPATSKGYDAVNKLVILARLAFDRVARPGRDRRPAPTASTARPARASRRSAWPTRPTRARPAGSSGSLATRRSRRRRRRRRGRGPADGAARSTRRSAATAGVRNRIEVDAEPVGAVGFDGPGAGGAATSSAVLGDLDRDRPRGRARRGARGRAAVGAASDAGRHDGRDRRGRSPRPRAASGIRSMTEPDDRASPAPRPRLMERYARFLPGHRRDPAADARRRVHAARPAPTARRGARAARTCTSRSRARTRPARSRTAAWSSPWPRPPRPARPADRLRLDRQHLGVGGGLRRGGRDGGRSSSCPRARSRSASCSRRSSPGRGSSPSTATSTRRSAIVRALAEQDDHPVTLVNSVNPFRLEGQKTAAFEICDDLGRAPDVLAIPVGNAGNISAYWAGFRDYAAAGLIGAHAADVGLPGGRRRAARPRPPGRAPGDRRDRDPDRRPGVVGQGGRRRATTSGGRIERRDRRRDPRRLPRAGPATRACSASRPRRRASPASRKAAAAGELDPDALVVCVLTGHGLKDPTTAERQAPAFLEAEPTVGAVAVALGW